MNYGYFDDAKREYVITRPDTPAPWANYLGSPEYGALISGNAGGYSFRKSGADGRILRYVFNGLDEPGRYLYIRDNKLEEYWSVSWKPVCKDLADFKTKTRHGLGYSIFETDYEGVHAEASYYVPKDATYEVWELTVKNDSNEEKDLTLTGFAEFTNHDNYELDQVNLQYSRFITRTQFEENKIMHILHGNLDAQDSEVDHKIVTKRFFGLAGNPVSSFCGDRDEFLGYGRRYGNPVGVEKGDLGNIEGANEYNCGALSTKVVLAPGEEKTVAFLLGMHYSDIAAEIISKYDDVKAVCNKELNELCAQWEDRLSALQVNTPDAGFNTMINTWNAYNCFMTFIWSRAASFIYCGLRNGYGYRDTVQDIQGIIHLKPEMAKEKIRFMLSAQVDNGGGLPLVKFTHNAGHEDTPDDESYVRETGHPAYRADDALWLFPTIYKYIAESGDLEFLNEDIVYANKDHGTVYDHLKRAIQFSFDHLGPHNMPAGLYADWNDCLRLGANGESTFVALQFYYALNMMEEIAAFEKDDAYKTYAAEKKAELGKIINDCCWDEDRFIRGYTEAGERIGERKAPEANMWLNPQSWAVISGLATPEQADVAMQNVNDKLNSDFGAVLMDPPYHSHAFEGALAVIYNQGSKENAGIFSQTQGWLILAEALLGHGNQAYKYYHENCPASQNEKAEIRHLEPFCYGQFTEGPASPHFGRSQVHWLTGTASTVMVGSVEGILGLRPDFYGLRLAPSINADWDGLNIEKTFRGKKLHIKIENPGHKESGCTSLTVNGVKMEGNYIPADILQDNNDVTFVL